MLYVCINGCMILCGLASLLERLAFPKEGSHNAKRVEGREKEREEYGVDGDELQTKLEKGVLFFHMYY